MGKGKRNRKKDIPSAFNLEYHQQCVRKVDAPYQGTPSIFGILAALAFVLILCANRAAAATTNVFVRDNFFSPANITISIGDTRTPRCTTQDFYRVLR